MSREAANRRPPVLGPAVPPVGRLDGCHLRRPTRHGDPVASDWLQALLGPEEPPDRARPSGRRAGGPSAHPTHGSRQPLWGAPRIHGELQKLGLEISQAAVSKYLGRRSKPPSQTWRTFLDNHLQTLVPVDFFVVPTVMFKVLFRFAALAHERRRVLHINVTDAPTAQWTAQQLVRRSPGRPPRDTSCAIAIRSTGSRSRGERSPWGSMKSRRRLGRLGRIRTWSASLGPCAASASTTSWC